MTETTATKGEFVQGGLRHEWTRDLPSAETVDIGSVYRDVAGQHWKLLDRPTGRTWARVEPMTKSTAMNLHTALGINAMTGAGLLVAMVVAVVFTLHTGFDSAPLYIAIVALAGAVYMFWRAAQVEKKLRMGFVPN